MYYEDQHDDWLTVSQCAARMHVSEARVLELVKRRALRGVWDGVLWVQPAILSGAV